MEDPSSNPSGDHLAASPNASILLQKAKNWTPQHLDVARVKVVENVSTEEIFGSEYVPADGDLRMHFPPPLLLQSTDYVVSRTRRAVCNVLWANSKRTGARSLAIPQSTKQRLSIWRISLVMGDKNNKRPRESDCLQTDPHGSCTPGHIHDRV